MVLQGMLALWVSSGAPRAFVSGITRLARSIVVIGLLPLTFSFFHLRLHLGLEGHIFCMLGVGTWCGRGLVDQGFPTVVLVLRHLVELLALRSDGAVDWQRWWDWVTRGGQVARARANLRMDPDTVESGYRSAATHTTSRLPRHHLIPSPRWTRVGIELFDCSR